MPITRTYETAKSDGLWYVFEVRNGQRASKPIRGEHTTLEAANAVIEQLTCSEPDFTFEQEMRYTRQLRQQEAAYEDG